MPQKRIRKTPIILAAVACAIFMLCSAIIWSLFGNTAPTLISAADISLSEIEYATIRVHDKSGALSLKKISSKEELSRLYDSLSHLNVKKRISFGTDAETSVSGISVKLKGESGLVRLCSMGNCFKEQNSSLLSPFFVCYYDVSDGQEFTELISSFEA